MSYERKWKEAGVHYLPPKHTRMSRCGVTMQVLEGPAGVSGLHGWKLTRDPAQVTCPSCQAFLKMDEPRGKT